jgi:hypothetical protein
MSLNPESNARASELEEEEGHVEVDSVTESSDEVN